LVVCSTEECRCEADPRRVTRLRHHLPPRLKPLIGYGRADRELQRDLAGKSVVGLRGPKRDGRPVRCPSPACRLAVALMHGGGNDVAQQSSELDE